MDNFRGIVLMICGMAAFACGDLFLKLSVLQVPLPQVVLVQALGGAAIFLTLAVARGERIWSRVLTTRPVVIRNLGEVLAVVFITIGLSLSDLAKASALMQTLPLIAVLGAVVFLGERPGWRRWTSVAVGLLGVLIVLRPTAGLDPGLVAILVGVLGLAARDLSTRAVDPGTSSVVLAAYSFASVIPVAGIWLVWDGRALWPTPGAWALLLAMTLAVALAFFLVTAALRKGEVSVIIPFRYTRLVFAMLLAIVFLGERPDLYVYLGSALIIGSGLYALWREHAVRAS
ncbi:MAG: DMT family transporter [Pseudomonadota bacterium]